mgnify:CR=1 FL=1|tara:strand:+ start:231 stop:605 length:375 start_codon:yes stop_codon:yes gene_type:complete
MTEVVAFDQVRRRVHKGPGGSTTSRRSEFFNRQELNQILQVYSRHVMSGEWLDYALCWDQEGAGFAIYGRVANAPLYTIVKRSRPGKRSGGRYQLTSRGKVLTMAATLTEVLSELARGKPRLVT